MLAHVLHDVAVADGGAHQRQTDLTQVALEPQVGHDGCDNAISCQSAAPVPALGNDGHDLIAVDDAALLVDDHDPVGVAVERHTNVGAHLAHLLAYRLRGGGTALEVDVVAVWLNPDLDHLGTELPQRVGSHLIPCAVGAIDHHAQIVQADIAR